MATKPTTGRAGTPGARSTASRASKPTLPKITPARFKEAMLLVERIVDENTDVFIERGQEYRRKHREGTSRPLTAAEAAQVATAMSAAFDGDLADLAVRVQDSDLRAYDQPDPREVLLAAGVATAPAFLDAVMRLVALIEMPDQQFRDAREDETLNEALETAVKDLEYVDLRTDGRTRASAAMEHFAAAAGVDSGKALGLVTRSLWQALSQAMTHLAPTSTSSSLTGSPPSTDGPTSSSATSSPGPEPASS